MLTWVINEQNANSNHFTPSTLDLAYDYGNLIVTFPKINNEKQSYHLEQTLIYDGISNAEGSKEKKGQGLVAIKGTLSLEGVVKAEALTDVTALIKTFELYKDEKVYLKANFYETLSELENSRNPYGTLVGIRPVKLVHEMMDLSKEVPWIRDYLKSLYKVTEEKINLMLQIAKAERPILEDQPEDRISLYICIPFCRTRCLYCSFPANPLDKKGHLMGRYVTALKQEITEMAEDLKARGITVDCIYIGGGTPTALTEEQFEDLLNCVTTTFDMEKVTEFTVEAGRPDTMSMAKLVSMKNHGVDRICVNPQTMVNKTLVAIGRDHKAEEVVSLYNEAKAMDFAKINMDLIAGLGDETAVDMAYTIDELLKLRPENITLHTLALKRASRLNEQREDFDLQGGDVVSEMVELATKRLLESGYEPYYMYRQKQMIGNLENIGFALPDSICLYNVRIMEERHSILALGAGAISKVYFQEENRLERFSNSKGLEDYLNRIDELIMRKKEWLTSRYDLTIMK